MPRVYLSLGSNVQAEKHLALGVRELARRWSPLLRSPVYRNRAVGFDGDDFLNMVVGFSTDATLDSIAREIELIHELAGRRRGAHRFVPRTLDIDLLLYGDVVTADAPIRLPRRDVLEYSFVLKPLADIAPAERHPATGRTFEDHWRDMAPGNNPLFPVAIEFDVA